MALDDKLTIESVPGKREGVRILKLSGPFILPGIFDFRSATRDTTAPVTIIDVSGVPYMDSAALGALLGFHIACERGGLRYFVVGVPDRILTLFRMANVLTVVVMADSVEQAEARAAG